MDKLLKILNYYRAKYIIHELKNDFISMKKYEIIIIHYEKKVINLKNLYSISEYSNN